jgi:hypothetical protein
MSQSDVEKCAKFTKLGRTQFVLRYGVLGWGVPTAILFSLIQSYRFGSDGFLFQLVPALILFPIGGIFFGRFVWRMLENKHAKAAATTAAD